MQEIDTLRKQLDYQSSHRGMRELDWLLGSFARQSLQTMNFEELLQFKELLAFPDEELYSWFFERGILPENSPQTLIEQINDFLKTNDFFPSL